jgi:hypothetical protein
MAVLGLSGIFGCCMGFTDLILSGTMEASADWTHDALLAACGSIEGEDAGKYT